MAETTSKPDGAAYGRALTGMGINILVSQVADTVRFTEDVLGLETVYADADFAILRHGGAEWMVHSDASYHSNPLLGLTGDGAVRGLGVELRIYGVDPDDAAARAAAHDHPVLQAPANKPHGLRECYLMAPDGYVWVPSQPLR
ncbi:MAG: hypothetical protein ACPGVX_04830 [Thalassobaculaceae bacterium]